MSSETNSDKATTATMSSEARNERESDRANNMNDTTSDAATVLTTATAATGATSLRSGSKNPKKTKTNVVGASGNTPTEVLPNRLPVYAEDKDLQFASCKPKLLPIKSHTLVKLERKERKVAAEVAAQSASQNRKKEIIIHYIREDGDDSNFVAESMETNWYEGTSDEAVEKIVNACNSSSIKEQFELQIPFEIQHDDDNDDDDDEDDEEQNETIFVNGANEDKNLAASHNSTDLEMSHISEVSSSSEDLERNFEIFEQH